MLPLFFRPQLAANRGRDLPLCTSRIAGRTARLLVFGFRTSLEMRSVQCRLVFGNTFFGNTFGMRLLRYSAAGCFELVMSGCYNN